ncbi:uncharacterized protein LOC141641059 [Silene latifolia]|uniref:uncharacterized protein LOC141641059 n=1 Tax=Silene latifolia TaxID=37657 RepID=UPI003D76DF7E
MVYAFNKVEETFSFWDRLKVFSSRISCAWLVCGEFNNVMRPNERLGSNVTDAETKDFIECMDVCGLMEMSSSGAFFTWNNKHESSTRVYSRLARYFINDDWLWLFHDATANCLPEGEFDHTPGVIDTVMSNQRRKGAFRYFNMWSLGKFWQTHIQGVKMFKVVMKLKLLKQDLKTLNKFMFSHIENSVEVAYALLIDIQKKLSLDTSNKVLMDEERDAAGSYHVLVAARHSYLAQKDKAGWILEADENYFYFHSMIKGRQARNKVLQIVDMNGNLQTNAEDIQQAFIDYYISLLGNNGSTTDVHIPTVKYGGPVINEDMSRKLMRPVSSDEIKRTI